MGEIRLLSKEVINHIAAGEVIERPASVVKELIENSLDAVSANISVAIEGGGVSLIRVADNGSGMDKEDLEMAILRHATSKIKDTQDLFNIHSLGFRGEALPSIVSVSKAKISTRNKGFPFGWFISIQGGDIIESGKIGMPEGTIVEIKDLFFNTPARKKFLKTTSTEQRNIVDIISRYALCYPNIGFSLKANERSLLNLSSNIIFEDRVKTILGSNLKDKMFKFSKQISNMGLHGIVASPDVYRPTRGGIYTFVNSRSVKDPTLTAAVIEGFKDMLMKNRYPVAIIFLNIDPKDIDINVHPTKAQVRFKDPSKVFGLIAGTIKETLRTYPWREEGVYNREATSITTNMELHDSEHTSYFTSRQGLHHNDESSHYIQKHMFEKRTSFYTSKDIVGVLHSTYILLQDRDALYILDQHASHERINFERMKAIASSGMTPSQILLNPVIIELSQTEYNALEEIIPYIKEIGFDCAPFGKTAVAVRAVPNPLEKENIKEIILSLIHKVLQENWKGGDYINNIIATIACHKSVTAGMILSSQEISALLRDLDDLGSPHTCPHGRPLYKKITLSEIEKWIGRRP
ncbi:MAG: DNA mismatch repair endonuclease MutL [Deltaproteobacteria bacterium]|nr:DNA mismatch repair endonuclease MutL [Deltaproteobacteria bacterium]